MIEAKKIYKLTGNTFANKEKIRAMGATWDKTEKVWTLDLSQTSKTRVQSALSHDAYRLSQNGVTFREAR